MEEQQSIPEISDTEVDKAKEACGVTEEEPHTQATGVAVHSDSHSVRVSVNMVGSMLKQKGEFDQVVMECVKKMEDNTAAFYIHYINQGRPQEE